MLETICYKILPETKRCTYFHFVLTTKPKTKRSQTTFIDFGGIIWSNIIKDNKSKHKAINSKPQSWSKVHLYTSNPWNDPFTSDFGEVCNLKVRYNGKF